MQPKDELLDRISENGGNVAQFASFAPNGTQRYARIREISPAKRFSGVTEAAELILKTKAPYVNIRTFLPDKPDGNPFFMGRKGLETPDKIAVQVAELMSQGFYIIINEEIDINDGGFSGVLLGNVAEFAVGDIPRCVEKPGCAVMPRLKMLNFARAVYCQRINIPYDRSYRVEFSVHPGPVGYAKQHQIIWQIEKTEKGKEIPEPKLYWPNRVSEAMGDKAYGLLMAHIHGFMVPHTRVVGRVIPPFEFGEYSNSPEACWRRTCPKVQQPGLFTTKHGQVDPFALMQEEDPDGAQIASMIFQDNVEALYSGAVITDASGSIIIEGKAGHGDDFMVGSGTPDLHLPDHVQDAVTNIWEKARDNFGSVRFEWCYDITGTIWIVQFHVEQSTSIGNIIFPGEPKNFEIFEVGRGLERLRADLPRLKESGIGIILKGNVGITSHFGDVLRRNQIPSRLERI